MSTFPHLSLACRDAAGTSHPSFADRRLENKAVGIGRSERARAIERKIAERIVGGMERDRETRRDGQTLEQLAASILNLHLGHERDQTIPETFPRDLKRNF